MPEWFDTDVWIALSVLFLMMVLVFFLGRIGMSIDNDEKLRKQPEFHRRGYWHLWFAWYPVMIDKKWVWNQWVEKNVMCLGSGPDTHATWRFYRLPMKAKKNDYKLWSASDSGEVMKE